MSIDPSQILTLLSITGVIIGVLFWIIDSRLSKVMQEFQPNGGQSVRDQLNRIEKKMEAVETKMDGHLNWHLDRP